MGDEILTLIEQVNELKAAIENCNDLDEKQKESLSQDIESVADRLLVISDGGDI